MRKKICVFGGRTRCTEIEEFVVLFFVKNRIELSPPKIGNIFRCSSIRKHNIKLNSLFSGIYIEELNINRLEEQLLSNSMDTVIVLHFKKKKQIAQSQAEMIRLGWQVGRQK